MPKANAPISALATLESRTENPTLTRTIVPGENNGRQSVKEFERESECDELARHQEIYSFKLSSFKVEHPNKGESSNCRVPIILVFHMALRLPYASFRSLSSHC